MIMENIFLIGFMGAGKSTVAAELQLHLKTKIIEMDEYIAHQQSMPITDIFATYGESYFRDLETQLFIEIKQKKGMIVSCGGGAVLRPENVAHMKESGKIVFLSASPETVYQRVKDSKERPLLNGNMNVKYIASLQEKRRDLYQAAADITVVTDGREVQDICGEILSSI